MLPPNQQEFPLVTVGIIVFNRAWIIKQMLTSLQNQTYPHDRLFVLVVDGESKDNTVTIAKQTLIKSDFNGYEIIVKDSNIPEARNICIQNMKGDFLLFWDSDVIMESTAISSMLEISKKENVDIVMSSVTEVFVDSTDEIDKKWAEWESKFPRQNKSSLIEVAGASNILISKKVLNQVSFDTDCTFAEDHDFSSRAYKQGFKILATRDVIGFDINNPNEPYSDIYAFDMPLKKALRGINKKGLIQVQSISSEYPSISKAVMKFFLANKRYLFYLGYPPIVILSVCGVLIQNIWLSLIFPLYFALYVIVQIKKRGFARGLNAAARSILVGIPTTYVLLYYSVELSFRRSHF